MDGRESVWWVSAAKAAFHIVQHSIGDPTFMRDGLRWIEASTAAGDVPKACAAFLGDRIAMYEVRPQRFGTQYLPDANGFEALWWIEDRERLDERRAEVGLEPSYERPKRRAEGDVCGVIEAVAAGL